MQKFTPSTRFQASGLSEICLKIKTVSQKESILFSFFSFYYFLFKHFVYFTEVLSSLTEREEKIIRLRFGIGEKADHTLEEVGSDFAVTRERIRQIEAKALRKLRHPTRSRKLKHFIDS